MDFQVRVLEKIREKDKATLEQAPDFNPFLPPEPQLTVCNVNPHHICVLNKFNVFDNHLLLVTKEFQVQTRRLDLDDIAALCTLMAERQFLAFYNGGPEAGASQKHKHLQLIPIPYESSDAEPKVPIEDILTPQDGFIQQSLPFVHRMHWFQTEEDQSEDDYASQWQNPSLVHAAYMSLMQDLDRFHEDDPETTKPYNFIMTRRWMMVVPRSRDRLNGVECNGIAFTGAMLVRSREHVDWLKNTGIFNVMGELCNAPCM